MADKKQTKVYLIPENETRDSHTYHYTAIKTRKFTLENKKMRLKKFNPVKRVHEWFCLLYTSPSPRDLAVSRMPSSA